MPKYLAVIEQEGGCDYTIGCGISTETFEAASPSEAIIKMLGVPDVDDNVIKIINDNYSINRNYITSGSHNEIFGDWGSFYNLYEQGIKSIKIYEISATYIPDINHYKKKAMKIHDILNDKKKELKEKEEYERLKKKFGNE